MKTQYDYDYFLQKFSAIPDERWCTGIRHSQGKSCALGHTHPVNNWDSTLETKALALLFGGEHYVALVNNGSNEDYQQPTPKARILAALADAKARAEAALEQYESRPLKPLSPVLQEQVIAADGPVSCEYLAGSSVVLEEA